MTNCKWPQVPEPYWQNDLEIPHFQSLQTDISTDVTIVGGGITGITAGYLLSLNGVKVTIIDAGRILSGTTGHTTAKITAQHGLIYDEIIQHFGVEQALMYYQSNDAARAFIKNTIQTLNINCNLEEHNAYIYTNTKSELKKLEKEAKAYEKLNITGKLVETTPLPLPMIKAILMEGQAQFHPLKYLLPLVQSIIDKGGNIFEHTTAVDVETGVSPKVITRNGRKITSKQIISCSHYPFYDAGGYYFTRMYAERSYVVAFKNKQPYPGGMYLSLDTPKRSVRSMNNLLLLGGESHKTGHGVNTMRHYEALATFGENILGVTDIEYRWSTQDLYTLDKVPYIGTITSNNKNIFIATGYRKWGMTNGTAAAMILCDLITKGGHPYEALFTPSRFKGDPSIKTFVQHNTDVTLQFIKGKIDIKNKHPKEVKKGEGAHVTINGKKCGAYRDDSGHLHIVDSSCTHLGCEVEWNEGEKSWDCPCHGSRFSINGNVIEGPADQPLKKVNENSTTL
ncbi:(2Fe-2S)-binding protein [Anaerobacillus alkalidiazotrophicus]|uniref:(2Fe-2S)-binding protein n=1 Tax=Anaerobacillus alkalidiazotrophicus TaxID=472963 RepID=A0A1S2M090_9BACI|nr:FAD-dependent oxidoreductase [Anaerobacillus alkalidiazotrophicus]OIJ18108.1 (2Fe-2S)-binding protein [Anaerobacillus alkalidiazotrophicus]OIJ19587.1 (2Fe-2S)-binding protein [Anaerobacillus alkalidiazotrophicus]